MAQFADAELLRAFGRRVRGKIACDLQRERDRAAQLRRRILPEIHTGLAQARAEGLCARAWLFGSYAWGEPSGGSDVDLMVEGSDEPLLVAVIVGRCIRAEVHVIARERAPASLVERVLSAGLAL